MPFVKLDCGMLSSTLWFEREAREVFITALLMAEPREFLEPVPQLKVDCLQETGWVMPAGWYGFVPAAGKGIIHHARVDQEKGMEALQMLGSPEETSRSQDFDGRRLIRVDGGYVVLNFMKYRDRDYTSAERSRRYRERVASRRVATPSHRDITQAEAEAEAEEKKIPPTPKRAQSTAQPATQTESAPSALDVAFQEFWKVYPKKIGKGAALKAWKKLKPSRELQTRMSSAIADQRQSDQWRKGDGQFIPNPSTWLNQGRWDDEPTPSDIAQTNHARHVDWFEECKRVHHGECELDRHRHYDRMAIERMNAQVG